MSRFRASNRVSVSAPLSEGASSITSPPSDPEKDGGIVDVREHARVAKAASVHQEDEEFEWREVIRGGKIISNRIPLFNGWCSRPA